MDGGKGEFSECTWIVGTPLEDNLTMGESENTVS